jgi:hypothetical protein
MITGAIVPVKPWGLCDVVCCCGLSRFQSRIWKAFLRTGLVYLEFRLAPLRAGATARTAIPPRSP